MNNPPVVWRKHKTLHAYLGMKGKIVVWTKIYVAPEGFEQEAPYIVALVALENGERKTLQVVDSAKDPKDNQTVEVVIRRIGKSSPDSVIEYGLKVRPV